MPTPTAPPNTLETAPPDPLKTGKKTAPIPLKTRKDASVPMALRKSPSPSSPTPSSPKIEGLDNVLENLKDLERIGEDDLPLICFVPGGGAGGSTDMKDEDVKDEDMVEEDVEMGSAGSEGDGAGGDEDVEEEEDSMGVPSEQLPF